MEVGQPISCCLIAFFTVDTLLYAVIMGALGGMGRGHLPPPLHLEKLQSVLCISRPNDSKTLSGRIIYALFSKHSSARLYRDSIHGPGCRWGTEAADLLICQPLEFPVGAHGCDFEL